MPPVKIIVTDLDRSLLRDDKTISGYSMDVFEKCRQRNIKIAFATGRPNRSIVEYVKALKPDAVIYMNGAIIKTGDMILDRHTILHLTAKKILKQIEEKLPESTLSVEIDDTMYSNFDLGSEWDHTRIDFNDLPCRDVDKIIIGTIPVTQMKELEIFIPDDLYLIFDTGKFGFILNKKASKWEGVKKVAAHFGIDTKDIVSFGDDLTDSEMLEKCGAGVAMGNAAEEVRNRAAFVCDTNENDGVAKWIEENVLA